MFKLSIIECVLIGTSALISGLFIQKMIELFAEDEIKENNIFVRFGKHYWFYILIFIIGICIHIFVSYLDINNWYCEQQCINNVCNIVCTIPINKLTTILLLK